MSNSYSTTYTEHVSPQTSNAKPKGFYITVFCEQKRETINLKRFGKDQISFGREQQNDIMINSSLVSRKHGLFVLDENECAVADVGSANGIYVNNKRISNYVTLKNGDAIRIDDLDSPHKQGVVMTFSTTNKDKEWIEFPLGIKDKYTIGRAENCDIRLAHVGVSKYHATIQRTSDGYELRDNNSTNGIIVNGKRLHGVHLLVEKDVILITNTKIMFTGNRLVYTQAVFGLSLTSTGVTRKVRDNGKDKILVNSVNLHIAAGEFVAIIGGSGAGKSTFMNCISGYRPATSGNVFINGDDLYQHYDAFKSIIGYVPQQDIVYDELTLESMLFYAARMRMPSDATADERKQRIQEVLRLVELDGKETVMIGRLSGGQKKRASIAIELLADPNLFFLDEPTSGLDPGTERNLMYSLGKLTASGKTVILVTHNTLNLHLCDKIIFLGKGGRLCFCGAPEDAMKFFGVTDFVNIYPLVSENSERYEQLYKQSSFNDYDDAGDFDRHKKSKEDNPHSSHKRNISAFTQFGIMSARYMQLIWNDRRRLALLLLLSPILALLIGLAVESEAFDTYNSARSALFIVTCTSIWIGIMNSIQEICKERIILMREYMVNLKLIPYILSKLFVLGLLCLIQSVLLVTIIGFFIKIPENGIVTSVILEMILASFLMCYSSTAMGLAVSAFSKNADRAMAVAPLLLIPQILFSGILFELEGVIEKISYLAISRWGMAGMGSSVDLNNIAHEIPNYQQEAKDIYEFTASHLGSSLLTLVAFWVVMGIISIVALKLALREK